MTTRSGVVDMTGMPTAPPFALVVVGSSVQLAAIAYTWGAHSPASSCITDNDCLASRSEEGAWSRTLLFFIGLIGATWLVSLVKRTDGHSDPSIVDKLWSILPTPVLWHYYASVEDGDSGTRSLVMAVLATLWSARLTYNFAIKGGYSGGEDYRWAVVRAWYPGWRFELFNLIFVCTTQLTILCALTAPAATAIHSGDFGALDIVATILFVVVLGAEALADHQMFVFQTEKHRRLRAGEELTGIYTKGFIDHGLWSISRHPNYFCEVSLWWVMYLFSIGPAGVANWTLCGPLALTLLFVPPNGSADVTEAISSRKYPLYADYQRRVNRFVPWFPKKAADASNAGTTTPLHGA